jgi:hypothetical protein
MRIVTRACPFGAGRRQGVPRAIEKDASSIGRAAKLWATCGWLAASIEIRDRNDIARQRSERARLPATPSTC